MVLFEKEFLDDLLATQEAPCLSLYQPTHRRHPDNQQDPIRFQNLVKKLEESLSKKFPAETVGKLLEPFEALNNDLDFWRQTLDGLAILSSPKIFRIYGLQRPVPELAIVADSFHTKPLQRYVQTTDRFQILGLTRKEVFLYEGNRDALDRLPLPKGVPSTIDEALGSELTEEHITVGTYGGKTAKGVNMVHGQGSKKDEVEMDTERFFRVIDRAIHEHCSKQSGLPLILAALPEHHNTFHLVSKNPQLQKGGIKVNPESQSTDALRKLAWEVWEPGYLEKIKALSEQYQQAHASQSGSDDLTEIAQAAASGRVGKLIIEEGKIIPGKMAEGTGKISRENIEDADVDDVLDDLGARVLAQGGEVFVLPMDKMPVDTGVAGIYRY